MLRRPPTSTLFPCTTLFRSALAANVRACRGRLHRREAIPPAGRGRRSGPDRFARSEEHTSELQSLRHLVCRLLLEKKKQKQVTESSISDRRSASADRRDLRS